MTTLELDAYRADVARDVLNISNMSLLEKIKKLIRREERNCESMADEDFKSRTHDEIVEDLKEALNEVKMSLEGKKVLRPAEKLLEEI